MANPPTPADLPPHVSFPPHWKHLTTHRVGPFITQVLHRLPGGAVHVWSSRRHRKNLGGMVYHETSGLAQEGAPTHVAAVHEHARSHQRKICWWGWRMQLLSWWIGLIFIIGSICFVVGTVPMAFPSVLDWFGLQPFNYGLVCFIGSIWFTIGSYLLVLEALNADADARFQLRAHEIERYLLGEAPVKPVKRIRWIGWEPKRLDFVIAVVQLTGALTFNINCGMGLVSGMNWIIADILVWTPSTIASCFFVTASYLGVMEVCHRPWAWLWWDVSWWVNFFSLLGSFGFLTSSLVGYFGQGPVQIPQWFGNYFALMMGSWFFLYGTYLMVPELLTEDSEGPVTNDQLPGSH